MANQSPTDLTEFGKIATFSVKNLYLINTCCQIVLDILAPNFLILNYLMMFLSFFAFFASIIIEGANFSLNVILVLPRSTIGFEYKLVFFIVSLSNCTNRTLLNCGLDVDSVFLKSTYFFQFCVKTFLVN